MGSRYFAAAVSVAATITFVFCAPRAMAEDSRQTVLAPNQWAQTLSDVRPDPAVRFGRLPNGMTYALMHNQTPVGQASFRLRIAAGSLMETDAQQGLAHFLEHMAFDGSTHVPNGEMVKILERHGLAFGADTNASTSWGETIYQLDLPKTDADTVDTSLMLLREIASELTLSQDAMDHERGAVLSEERLRDTPDYRAFKSQLQFLLPGQKASERMPIGQVEVVRTAQRAELKDFYDKYYRPDRTTLVVVGDFDVDAMEAKIKARFGGWANRAPAGAEPDLGALQPRKSEAQMVVQPGAGLSMQVAWNRPADNAPETLARDRTDALEDLAVAVLNRRLGRITRGADAPFISASADQEDLYGSARSTTLEISSQPDKWKAALAAAVREQQRLVDYGVLKSELDREIEDARTTLTERVATAQTRNTRALANMIVGSLGDHSVVQSPAQELEQFDDTVKTITAQQVSAAARHAFSGVGPLVFMATPQPVDGGAQVLKAAYDADQAEQVAAPTVVAEKAWPYARFGASGKVVERREIPEFGATMVRFANGVRLTVKPTAFRRSEVQVQVRFGHGRLDLSKAAPSPLWAGSSFLEGGLKQLTAEDIDQTLNNKVVGASFSLDDNAFVLSGAAKSSDLDTQMQLLAAYVAEPAFRPEAFERMRAYGLTLDSQMDATPGGVMGRDLAELLHSGDVRWATPSNAAIAASKISDLKAILTEHLNQGPIEVVIVGDIDPEAAIAATASTLGALNRDPAPVDTPAAAALAVSFPKPLPAPVIERHKGRADQAVAAIAWRTNDFYADMREARVLTVLSQVIQLRMIDDLRVAKGDTYSPRATLSASQTFPGYGYLMAEVETPPDRVSAFYDDLAKVSRDLRAAPVSQDELTRAVLPLVDQLKQARQTNPYWISALADAQTDPRKLESIRTQVAQYQSVSAADLQKAAQKYLAPDQAWRMEILPEAKVAQANVVQANVVQAEAASQQAVAVK